MAELEVLVPQTLAQKLKVIEETKHEQPTVATEILEELAGKEVDNELRKDDK